MKVKRNVSKAVLVPADDARRAERVARAKQAERNDLLEIAQCFVEKHERQDAATVLPFAEQLLAWLNESGSDLDRSARRDALHKVRAAAWGARHEAVAAAALIERASVYYRFIAA